MLRLTGLTFESQNGAVQGPSRIIQPLARFTDNKTFGRMHFVPPERTYLKLRNPHKIMVQEIQIDIVTVNDSISIFFEVFIRSQPGHCYTAGT